MVLLGVYIAYKSIGTNVVSAETQFNFVLILVGKCSSHKQIKLS